MKTKSVLESKTYVAGWKKGWELALSGKRLPGHRFDPMFLRGVKDGRQAAHNAAASDLGAIKAAKVVR